MNNNETPTTTSPCMHGVYHKLSFFEPTFSQLLHNMPTHHTMASSRKGCGGMSRLIIILAATTSSLSCLASAFTLSTALIGERSSWTPSILRRQNPRAPSTSSLLLLATTVVSPIQIGSDMPPPLSELNLRNRYYLLRHGQSTANVAEIISSSRSLAYTETHGLTPDVGYLQGKHSAKALLDCIERTSDDDESSSSPRRRLILISSPFARAKQTAEACLDGLQEVSQQDRLQRLNLQVDSTDIPLHDKLVERYFGRLDAQAIYTYAYVWPLDRFNVTHTAFDVESVAAVCHRLYNLIQDCEAQYQDCHLVLVSHADVLQIAQLYAAGADNVGLFSSYRFRNGEVRPMVVGSTAMLPEPVPLQAPDRGTSLYEKQAYDISRRER
jgi:broad specificity phosphatase PhoE